MHTSFLYKLYHDFNRLEYFLVFFVISFSFRTGDEDGQGVGWFPVIIILTNSQPGSTQLQCLFISVTGTNYNILIKQCTQ